MRSRGQSPLLPYSSAEKFPSRSGRRGGRTTAATRVLIGVTTLVIALYGLHSFFGTSTGGGQAVRKSDGSGGRGLTAHEEVAQLQGMDAPVLDRKAADENQQLQTQGAGHGTADKAPELNSNGLSADHAARAADSVQQAAALDLSEPSGLYTLAADDIDGKPVQLSTYAGRVSLVVNVASECGYTDSNYRGLQALYEKYKAAGFEVLAFPCNGFGGQEPGSEQSIKEFARQRYGVTFPLFQKVEVAGEKAHPVFKFLQAQLAAKEGAAAVWQPRWNFSKWLCDRSGQPVQHYDSAFDGEQLERDIAALLMKTT